MDEAYEKIIEYIKNNYKKIIFPFIIILLYIGGFIYLYFMIKNNSNKEVSINAEVINSNESDEEEIVSDVYIDVKGSVVNPGVYKLNSDSRVIDAISAAGGVSEGANTRFINLSKKVNDGDVIVVYSNKEIEEATKENIIYVETPCICEEVENNACYVEEDNYSKENESETLTNNSSDNTNTIEKININTASIEELTTLSGIGEAKAKAIIEYREENGLFKTIEDLVNVSGISETLFSKIKENITV